MLITKANWKINCPFLYPVWFFFLLWWVLNKPEFRHKLSPVGLRNKQESRENSPQPIEISTHTKQKKNVTKYWASGRDKCLLPTFESSRQRNQPQQQQRLDPRPGPRLQKWSETSEPRTARLYEREDTASWARLRLWRRRSDAWVHCPGSWRSWSSWRAAGRPPRPLGGRRTRQRARWFAELHSPSTRPTCCCRKQTCSFLILQEGRRKETTTTTKHFNLFRKNNESDTNALSCWFQFS